MNEEKKLETILENGTPTFDQIPTAMVLLIKSMLRVENLLKGKLPEPEVKQPKQFNLDGATEYLKSLGLTISKGSIQNRTPKGAIPCKKFNGRLVFFRDELDAWVQSQTKAQGDSSAVTLRLASSANRKLRK